MKNVIFGVKTYTLMIRKVVKTMQMADTKAVV